jgi:hypothetical protein
MIRIRTSMHFPPPPLPLDPPPGLEREAVRGHPGLAELDSEGGPHPVLLTAG